MLREAERQLKSSLMDQDMVATYLELVKVVRVLHRLTFGNINAPDPGEKNAIPPINMSEIHGVDDDFPIA